MEKNGIHIIDLNKTISSLDEASAAMRAIVRSGRKIMFVATKKQAQEIVTTEADKLKMPYVTDRWLGGMLTNFATVRKSIKKMSSIDKMLKDEVIVKTLAKRERLMMTREEEKLKRVLGGITELTRLPAALFIVDVKREHIAVSEAKKLGIPVFAMCDTNSNPDNVDYVIPGNDDAIRAVTLYASAMADAILAGKEYAQSQANAQAKGDDAAKDASEA
jgi:small subunit ribosomal protein S2